MKYPLVLLSITSLISGCASNFKVFDSEGNEGKGIPIPQYQVLQVVQTTYYKDLDQIPAGYPDNLCSPTISVTYKLMPTDKVNYIKFEPSELSNGKFDLEFTDAGLLKKVSINSEAGSTASKAADLVTSLVPYGSMTKKEEADSDNAALVAKLDKLTKNQQFLSSFNEFKANNLANQVTILDLVTAKNKLCVPAKVTEQIMTKK